MIPSISKERVSEVIRTDATVVNKTDFLATHTPFRNIHYGSSATREIDEQDIRKANEEDFFNGEILARRDSHQFIVVRGNPGSGKSHFIRWMKERYESSIDTDTEEVMFISRSQNTLQSALEQITDSGVLRDSIAEKDFGMLMEAKQNLSDKDLKKSILLQFAAASDRAYEDGSFKRIDRRYARDIYNFLVDETVRNHLIAEGRVIERIATRLNAENNNLVQEEPPRFLPEDFVDTDTILGAMDRAGASKKAIRLAEKLSEEKEVREQVTVYLNSHLETVVQECTKLQSGDLRRIFDNLRKELKKAGKNLTLFIEDITSFVGIDRAFMEVLVTEHRGTEHNEKFCRVFSVVGVTNDYFRTDLPGNLKERMTMVIFLDEAALASDQEVVEMVARYMNAIYQKPENLYPWVERGAKEKDLPLFILEPIHLWATFELEDGRVLPIFPFNNTAIMNMFGTLRTKTPRRLLQDVVAHTLKLYHFHRQDKNFPPAEKEMREGFTIPTWQEHTHENILYRQSGAKADNLSTLLRLWGDGTVFRNTAGSELLVGGLTEGVFASFELPFIKGIGEKEKVDPQPGPTKPEIVPPPIKQPGDFEKMQRELAGWVDGSSLINPGRLREDLRNLIIDFIDWEMEGVSGAVASVLVTDLSWFSIEGQRLEFKEEGFQVRRSKESQWVLLALCGWRYKGGQSWRYEGSGADLANLHNWLNRHKAEIVNLLKTVPVPNGDNWDLPRWLLLAGFYCRLVASQTIPASTDTVDIYRWMFDQESTMVVQENRSNEWSALQRTLNRRYNLLRDQHSMLIKYFNRKQVDIRQDTEVYFIDAVEPLQLIDELAVDGWDLKCCQVQPEEKETAIWYQAPKLINIVRGVIQEALEGEKEHTEKVLGEIKSFIGEDSDGQEFIVLWEEMKKFLDETLPAANEGYFAQDFELLNVKDAEKHAVDAIRGLDDFLEAKDFLERLLCAASHPVEAIMAHLIMLKKMDNLVTGIINKFTNQIAQLGSGGDASSLREKAETEIEELLDSLAVCTMEVESGDA